MGGSGLAAVFVCQLIMGIIIVLAGRETEPIFACICMCIILFTVSMGLLASIGHTFKPKIMFISIGFAAAYTVLLDLICVSLSVSMIPVVPLSMAYAEHVIPTVTASLTAYTASAALTCLSVFAVCVCSCGKKCVSVKFSPWLLICIVLIILYVFSGTALNFFYIEDDGYWGQSIICMLTGMGYNRIPLTPGSISQLGIMLFMTMSVYRTMV